MKKRLRKKLNLGEFKETGFNVTWKFDAAIDEAGINHFFDDFIAAVEEKGLAFGGGGSGDESWEGIVAKDRRYTCPDASDRTFITEWFKSRTDVREFSVDDEDIDLWYSCECCC